MKKIFDVMTLFVIIMNLTLCGQLNAKVVYVRKTPPAKKITVVKTVPPFSNAIWIEGRWVWTGGKFVWRKGYWVKNRKNYIWVSGKWVRQSEGWVWIAGYWRRIR